MDWDKFKIAQKFLQKANAIHPEDSDRKDLHDKALALQDVYYDCYMSSFSRQDLLKRLQEIIGGKIEMPEEQEVDEVKYKEAYVKEAKSILTSIESGEFKSK
jgi:hypothetical protein